MRVGACAWGMIDGCCLGTVFESGRKKPSAHIIYKNPLYPELISMNLGTIVFLVNQMGMTVKTSTMEKKLQKQCSFTLNNMSLRIFIPG